jgi:hypothetical protein
LTHRANRVTAHQARAWLADYTAACRRDTALLDHHGCPGRAGTLHQVAEHLESLLCRWDITADCDHRPP